MTASKQKELPAGNFSTWLDTLCGSLENLTGIDVPCEGCVACCQSSYFIHIRPVETKTLAHIPKKLLCAAPGLPKGHMLLGHFENGDCPMLHDKKCGIYECRPRTCRFYDCRIFPATGIMPKDRVLKKIVKQSKRWKFEYSNKQDITRQAALLAAADFLNENASLFPEGFLPRNPTQIALLAIKVHKFFLKPSRSKASTITAIVKIKN